MGLRFEKKKPWRVASNERAWAACALLLFGLGTGCSGCVEKLVPDKVAMAVGRLTVRNAAIIAKLVDADAKCGFASAKVARSALVQGSVGGPGAVVWKVEDCRVDFPAATLVSTDCTGVETTVKGSVTVSATKRVRGTLTGDANKPVIPEGADAATLDVDVVTDGFTVYKTDSTAFLTMLQGALHFSLEPRLALSKSLGVCAVSTLDLTFKDIRYKNGAVVVTDESRSFSVDVPSSSYRAQVGKWGPDENSLAGRLIVWDNEQTLPVAGDTDGLDPAYTPQAYFEQVACTPDLATPISYGCPSLKEQVVHGASRLTIKQLGTIASLADADTRCGFSSPSVRSAAKLNGAPGTPGSATLTISTPCTLTFAEPTPLAADCNGVTQTVQGTVTVTGSQTITGVLSGDVNQPVVPDSVSPAVITLTAQVADFTLRDSVSSNALTAKSGTLSAIIKPRVAIDTRNDICAYVTPVASFEDVEWSNAVLDVVNDGLTFEVPISQASFAAQSGTTPARTNYLEGVVVSEGLVVSVPPAGSEPILDPAFDAAQYEKSFSCKPGFKMATDDASCSVTKALATNAARLLMLAAGTMASEIQNDTHCGFSALLVKTMPTQVTGADGEMGSLTWDVNNCRVGQQGVSAVSTDCIGVTTYLSGTAALNARRIVTGERDSALVIFDSIIPRGRDALTLQLTQATLADFSAYKIPAGQTDPYAKLVLHSGTFSGQVVPALAERRSKPGVYDVGTPVATFTDIHVQNAPATLYVAGKHFSFVINGAQLAGRNGTLNGVSNTVSGQVTIGDETVTIPEGTVLDPEFTQTRFDSTYACTADLGSLIPSQ